LELSGGGNLSTNPQQFDWRANEARSWSDTGKERILFLIVRGVWLCIIGGQDFSLANYVSLWIKAGQGINNQCDTMQAAKKSPFENVKASYSDSFCGKVGVICVYDTFEVLNELLCLSFNLITNIVLFLFAF
jgi:hypothetical protein